MTTKYILHKTKENNVSFSCWYIACRQDQLDSEIQERLIYLTKMGLCKKIMTSDNGCCFFFLHEAPHHFHEFFQMVESKGMIRCFTKCEFLSEFKDPSEERFYAMDLNFRKMEE